MQSKQLFAALAACFLVVIPVLFYVPLSSDLQIANTHSVTSSTQTTIDNATTDLVSTSSLAGVNLIPPLHVQTSTTDSATTSKTISSSTTAPPKSNQPIAAPAESGGGNTSAPAGFFPVSDLQLINLTAKEQANYILSLQLPNGAILESNQRYVVFTRDLALAAIGLTLNGYTSQSGRAVEFLLSLKQGASNFSRPANVPQSPDAWYQVYDGQGDVYEQSLRGEDQGMALFAISDYILATGNYSLATRYWGKIESAANFIVYLQQTPEPGMPFTGMYRHGDNWLDSRIENMQDGTPMYWPYWPEYYHWEEENMRMIMGLHGAISLAENLGYKVDARVWNASVSLALLGLANENKYNKFETYDYFGSVLWGIQANMTLAKRVVQNLPADLLTGYGLKDLPWENYASSPDTIDYMVCLARIGDLPAAEHYLNLIVSDYSSPSGGFYGSLYMNGSLETSEATVFASARFLYFASVANSMG